MALYTKKQLAALIGKKTSYITQYIKRGKLDLTESEHIDSENQKTINFLLERKDLIKNPTKKQPTKEKNTDFNENLADLENKTEFSDEEILSFGIEDTPDNGGNSLSQIHLAWKIKLLKKQEELASINVEIKKGKLIPIDMVMLLFSNHFKSVTNQFHQGADQVATIFAKKHKLEQEDLVEIKKQIIDIANKSVDRAQQESISQIENLIDEFSQKLQRGEKKT